MVVLMVVSKADQMVGMMVALMAAKKVV